MNMQIGPKEKNLLIGVLGVLILVVVWFLIVSPMKEELAAVEAENVTLSAKAEQYQSIMSRLDEYEEGITTAEAKIAEITDRYPALVSTEDLMMFWANIDTALPLELRFGDLEIREVDDAVYVAGVDGESLENVDIITEEDGKEYFLDEQVDDISAKYKLFGAPMAMNFACTYNGLKYMINYITSQTNKNSIIGFEIYYDEETGYLTGAVGVELYYIEGLEKEYVPTFIPAVPKGLSDVFHTGADTVSLLTNPADAPVENEVDATPVTPEDLQDELAPEDVPAA